jgi:hypothetical protein
MRLLILGLVLVVAGCSAIKRDAACVAAEKCDDALQAEVSGTNTHGFANGQGVSQFGATDPVFGDDLDGNPAHAGQFGNVGSCWQSADTAKPCVDQCNQFVKDQQVDATANNDAAVLAACGGKVSGAGEGEGEGGQ